MRPIVYYLPAMVASGHVLREARSGRRAWKPFVMRLVLFVIVAMGPLVLWQVRNQKETDFGGFSGVSSSNIYFYQGASVLILVFACYVAMSGGPGGESRFRVPLMPLLCVLTACGLKRIEVWRRAREFSSPIAARIA